jgi:hypothetical protein
MSDAFEFRLERMFAAAPSLADGELFTARVMDRLGRGWNARRLIIGGMGAVGGLVGAYQIVGSVGVEHLAALGAQSHAFVARQISAALPSDLALGGIGLDVRTLVMIGALAIVGAAFGVARLIREI